MAFVDDHFFNLPRLCSLLALSCETATSVPNFTWCGKSVKAVFGNFQFRT